VLEVGSDCSSFLDGCNIVAFGMLLLLSDADQHHSDDSLTEQPTVVQVLVGVLTTLKMHHTDGNISAPLPFHCECHDHAQ
jgi:hypothetical protein